MTYLVMLRESVRVSIERGARDTFPAMTTATEIYPGLCDAAALRFVIGEATYARGIKCGVIVPVEQRS